MTTYPNRRFLQIAFGILLGSGLVSTRADYAAKVLSNSPAAYWRLNETAQVPAADLAHNGGSVGAAADGFYVGAASHPVGGALAAGSDTAVSFDATAGTAVSVPYHAGLNPNSAFSVEAWLNPNVDYTAAAPGCAIASGQFASPRSGWLIYQVDTGWAFRMYKQDALNTSVNITGGPAPVIGIWQHVVAVYDGTNAYVYVNGAQTATGVPTGYVPSAGGPLFIGARSDSSFWWNGVADEVALYAKALTATEIDAHYRSGISAAPATPYNQVVLNSGPVAYYRLNEASYTPPDTLPVAKNLGSMGNAWDGSYNPGADAQAAGLRTPMFNAFEADNTGVGLNGAAGYVGTTASLNDLATFTVMGWIKRGTVHSARGGYFGQNDLLELGDADNGVNIEAYINAYAANIKIPYPFLDNEWGLITVVGQATQVTVYTNGVAASTLTHDAVDSYGSSTYNFNIGGGGVFNIAGDNFLGTIDEVALFDKALTAAEVEEIYYAANIAPTITRQPAAPARDIFEGNPVTLSVDASGNSPLLYQWRKGGADLAGKTFADLVFDNITMADAGGYDVVVHNAYGMVTSAVVNLTIKPADTVPPVLLSARGSRSFTQVRVWFSEGVDPVTAQTASNYQLSDGVTVSSATLSGPAGSAGDNIVDLVTSAQTPGHAYTLTVNGVKDQAVPANAVAAGSSAQFSSWTLVPGALTFEHYDNITGSAIADITRGLTDPRVVAGNPTTSALITGEFNTDKVFTDDTHENYLARISGVIIPKADGEYTFFVRSDDASQVYLSTNDVPPNLATATPICVEAACCRDFQEPGDAATSAPIPLKAGKPYAITALLKEGTGGDYLMVSWRESADSSAAAGRPNLSAEFFGTYVDPNVDMNFEVQPTDQIGVLASTGIEMLSEDFNASNAGYTVVDTDPAPQGPWLYDSATGKWVADGGSDDCVTPSNSQLNSPAYTLAQDGALSLTFSHRYSFESGLFDGGQVRISVNGGEFTPVPATNFTANGYAVGNIVGNGALLGQQAFNDDSPGFATGEFITSKASLGAFAKNDTVVVQFLGAWDECTANKRPSWTIDSLKIDLLPMIIQDFAKNDGGFTVTNTTPAPPGPWIYAGGLWSADGSADGCTGPYNSQLNSPAYVVPQADEATLTFTHRYSFESGLWDAGQVRVSVNGGAFTTVPAEHFTANGYADGAIVGTGVLKDQRGFNADSPGYAGSNFITSSAILGTFNKNDTIAVQFIGAWDDCGGASRPSWVIKDVQLVFGKAPQAATFETLVTASKQGVPVAVTYQWQRDDGAGFVDIFGANTSTFRIFPVAADLNARFRVVAKVPGKAVNSNTVKLLPEEAGESPTISISNSGGVTTVVYTGTLQFAGDVAGPFQNVTGAVTPYIVPAGAGIVFFRSVK